MSFSRIRIAAGFAAAAMAFGQLPKIEDLTSAVGQLQIVPSMSNQNHCYFSGPDESEGVIVLQKNEKQLAGANSGDWYVGVVLPNKTNTQVIRMVIGRNFKEFLKGAAQKEYERGTGVWTGGFTRPDNGIIHNPQFRLFATAEAKEAENVLEQPLLTRCRNWVKERFPSRTPK